MNKEQEKKVAGPWELVDSALVRRSEGKVVSSIREERHEFVGTTCGKEIVRYLLTSAKIACDRELIELGYLLEDGE